MAPDYRGFTGEPARIYRVVDKKKQVKYSNMYNSVTRPFSRLGKQVEWLYSENIKLKRRSIYNEIKAKS